MVACFLAVAVLPVLPRPLLTLETTHPAYKEGQGRSVLTKRARVLSSFHIPFLHGPPVIWEIQTGTPFISGQLDPAGHDNAKPVPAVVGTICLYMGRPALL